MILQRLFKGFSRSNVDAFFGNKRSRILRLKMIVISLIISVLYVFLESRIGFVKTLTPSLPYRYFIIVKRSAECKTVPKKNRYVYFCKKDAPLTVVKQVKGLPGSTLRYDHQGNLWVDDFCVGKPRYHSSHGVILKPIPAGIVPSGFVFGYAPHEKSFDSRYENFGLIPISSIKGVGVAIL